MTTELKRLSDTVWKDPATLNLGDSSFKSVFVFTVCPFLEGSTLKKGLVAEHTRQSDLIKSAFNRVETHRAAPPARKRQCPPLLPCEGGRKLVFFSAPARKYRFPYCCHSDSRLN